MKITDIRTFHCSDGVRNNVFLQVHTDEGIAGAGEPYTVGPDEGVISLVESIKPWFVGQDPSRIEWLLRRARNNMRFPIGPVGWSALSGIDHALWDIAGKAAGLPVYMLLGGRHRDKVRVYHGVRGDTLEELADNARALIDEGYTALKTSPYSGEWRAGPWNAVVRGAAARLEALRDAVGPDVDIGVDVHATLVEPMRAEQIAAAMAPYRPMFIEEPARPEHFPSFARLRERIDVPLATGENLYGLAQFVSLIDAGGVDIIQPDLCSGGGLSGGQEDRRRRRGRLRHHRATQPTGPAFHRGLHPLRRQHPELHHTRVPRRPRQAREGQVRRRPVEARRRLDAPADSSRPRHGSEHRGYREQPSGRVESRLP